MIPLTLPKPKPKHQPWDLGEMTALAAFVIWSGLGLTFIFKHITPDEIAKWPVPPSARDFIDLCIQYGDLVLIFLAFINTHLHAARQWSAPVARRWGLIVIAFAFGIEAYGVRTGFPFGDYHYTENFGTMLLNVPLIIPLAWHVVVTNSLFLIRAIVPHLSRLIEAAFAGIVCTIYDSVLEPFATTVKHYWNWADGSVPPLNYAAWFLLSTLLIRIFAPTISTRYRFDVRPAMILLLTVLIFIAGELKH